MGRDGYDTGMVLVVEIREERKRKVGVGQMARSGKRVPHEPSGPYRGRSDHRVVVSASGVMAIASPYVDV